MGEQILQGEWIWKKNKVKLELWNPSWMRASLV